MVETLALALHSWAEEEGRGRAYRSTAHRAFFIEGLERGYLIDFSPFS